MSAESDQPGLFGAPGGAPGLPPGMPACRLVVALDFAAGGFRFEWSRADTHEIVARGLLAPAPNNLFRWRVLAWQFIMNGQPEHRACGSMAQSIHPFLKRICKRLPLAKDAVQVGILPDVDRGALKAGKFHEVVIPPDEDALSWLAGPVKDFAKALKAMPLESALTPQQRGREALTGLVSQHLAPAPGIARRADELPARTLRLRVTFDTIHGCALLEWTKPPHPAQIATGKITCTGPDELAWKLTAPGPPETIHSPHHLHGIQAALRRWLARFPVRPEHLSVRYAKRLTSASNVTYVHEAPFDSGESGWHQLAEQIQAMAEAMRTRFSPLGSLLADLDPLAVDDFIRHEERLLRREQKRAEEEARQRETMARLAEERRRKQQAAAARQAAARKTADRPSSASPAPVPRKRPALPPVPMRLELPELALQETTFPLADLRGYFLRERAARWWVSNQSDDLLALPYCRIQRLDYQLRTALRVLGPMRGRALLSDEVGLGKTIEAGLVLKELLTRGMVKRFLVLTVPSLVDQWEEELNDKFGLVTVTTNHAATRADTAAFWREHPALVASLHTLKQPAHLEVARTVNWDLLIVDEAHYLRNRESQAWRAVNALPRQFLLLLTATPVQNSLEELYNLVTLLQPGQLPSPKEFRARFVDPKRPRQPREPEELRRLLGQVMIRNTRANAGLKLPPRRAETVRLRARRGRAHLLAGLGNRTADGTGPAPGQPGEPVGTPAAAVRRQQSCRLAQRLGKVPSPLRRSGLARARPAGGQLAEEVRSAAAAGPRRRRTGRVHAVSPDAGRARGGLARARAWRPFSSTARRPPSSGSPSPKRSANRAARCCSPTAGPKAATCNSAIGW